MGSILLPGKYLTGDEKAGDVVDVFVYFDSDDRLIATREGPYLEVGDFGSLEVVEIHPRAGAFLDWGLEKDLLLPYREQVGRVKVGMKVLVGVRVDRKSGRIAATMRTNQLLASSWPNYKPGRKVSLIISERTNMGFNAIVDSKFVGLLYHSDLAKPLCVGDTMEGFVRQTREDGKLDLSLTRAGYGKVPTVRDGILELLKEHKGRLPLGDKSSPEEVRKVAGVSKKSFKQAIGALYKERLVELSDTEVRLLEKD